MLMSALGLNAIVVSCLRSENVVCVYTILGGDLWVVSIKPRITSIDIVRLLRRLLVGVQIWAGMLTGLLLLRLLLGDLRRL